MKPDLREKIKKIRAPVLLLGATAAMSDPEAKMKTEEAYRRQMKEVPRLKVVFAPRARHFIQLDEPEFFYREVELFLNEAVK